MKPTPRIVLLTAVLFLPFAALAATPTVVQQVSARPAVWFPYDLIVDLQDLPQPYTCDDLWYRFRDVLLSIGARPDMTILPYRCDSRSPRVHVQFSLPHAVSGTDVRAATLQVTDQRVRLEAHHPGSLQDSDCALLQQVKDTLLAALPVPVVSYRFTCAAPGAKQRQYHLTVQAFAVTRHHGKLDRPIVESRSNG